MWVASPVSGDVGWHGVEAGWGGGWCRGFTGAGMLCGGEGDAIKFSLLISGAPWERLAGPNRSAWTVAGWQLAALGSVARRRCTPTVPFLVLPHPPPRPPFDEPALRSVHRHRKRKRAAGVQLSFWQAPPFWSGSEFEKLLRAHWSDAALRKRSWDFDQSQRVCFRTNFLRSLFFYLNKLFASVSQLRCDLFTF